MLLSFNEQHSGQNLWVKTKKGQLMELWNQLSRNNAINHY